MMSYQRAIVVVFVLILLLVPMACVGSEKETPPSLSNGVAGEATGSGTNSSPPAVPVTSPSPVSTPEAPPSSTNASILDVSKGIADIVQDVQPAVVFISAKVETRSFFFNRRTIQASSGSGVIVSSDGHILTNNHVVENAVDLEVTVPGFAEPFKADVVGTDPLTDLAVIDIDGEDFPTVPFGNASALRPGNLVIAVGYPLALEQGATITLGVVSNTERSFTLNNATYYDVIQTDAAINPGNSGGPLIDLNGNIVGVNSVIAGTAQNIGFAISANTVVPVYEALTGDGHRMVRPWLGVSLVTVTPDMAANADLARQSGVVARVVEKGSPADKAGIEVRDVITEFDGKEVTEATQLIKELWRHQLGDSVNVVFWRGTDKKETVVELTAERPE